MTRISSWGVRENPVFRKSKREPRCPQMGPLDVETKPLGHEVFAPCFMALDMFQCLLAYSLWELKIESVPCCCVKNLNYIEIFSIKLFIMMR